MLYFSADLHLGHNLILKFQPRRTLFLGTSIKEHDANVIDNINCKVGEDDTLVLAGDFSLNSKDVAEYRSKIKAKNVILILGNHDKNQTFYYNCGFSCVCYEMTLKIAGEFVRIRHHPYRIPKRKTLFPWSYKEKDRKKRPKDYGQFLLHGHCHGEYKLNPYHSKSIHIGLDAWNYYPISIKEIERLISKRRSELNNKRRRFTACAILKKIKRSLRLHFRRFRTMS